MRIVMMNNHGVKEYSGAGIPDYMIPEISKVLEKPLISSSNHAIENDVYRTPDATKVWERLKS